MERRVRAEKKKRGKTPSCLEPRDSFLFFFFYDVSAVLFFYATSQTTSFSQYTSTPCLTMPNRRDWWNGCCAVVSACVLLVALSFLVHVITVQVAPYDSDPAPACQHLALSARCVDVDFAACTKECRPPKLAVHVRRQKTAEVAAGALDDVAGKAVDDAIGDDKRQKRDEDVWDGVYYGADIVPTLTVPERVHFAQCIASCLQHREHYHTQTA